MTCPICNGRLHLAFTAQVLHKYNAKFEFCKACGFLRACEPYWLEEAYSSPIATADTGLVMRNISLASQLATVLYVALGERGASRYLDAAGGYGMLTRLMRDIGFDFYWSDKYCENLLARGFEYDVNSGPCKAVTAMEVMEHLTDPLTFVDETLRDSGATNLFFTTELYSGDPPNPKDWWYYMLPTGQHIAFFQHRTLKMIGQRLGLYFSSANGLHVLSKAPINDRLYTITTNPILAHLVYRFVRKKIGSRTLGDHQEILRKHQL